MWVRRRGSPGLLKPENRRMKTREGNKSSKWNQGEYNSCSHLAVVGDEIFGK